MSERFETIGLFEEQEDASQLAWELELAGIPVLVRLLSLKDGVIAFSGYEVLTQEQFRGRARVVLSKVKNSLLQDQRATDTDTIDSNLKRDIAA